MNQQPMPTPPSASKLDLDDESMRVAGKIHAIMEAKDQNGEHKYSDLEVRDFIVACIFELGIPMSLELQIMMNDFIVDELEIENPEPTMEDLVLGIQGYFQANPLNEELGKKFQELGAMEMFKGREGFKHDGGQVNRSLASAGVNAVKRAPRAQEMGPKTGKLKVKRGLS